MPRSHRPLLGLVLLGLFLVLAFGCRQEVPPLFQRNQPPETFLTVVPEDSARGFYRYHVYWHGQDTDGRIERYLFAITDTLERDENDDWTPVLADDKERGVFTTKTDSIFLFNAARGRQALHMSAVDDFGDFDLTPARAFFFTFNNGLPSVEFLDVRAFRDDGTQIAPCTSAACTVATFTNFKVRYRGTTRNGVITGFQWQAALPNQPAEATQPFGVDSLFLPAGVDTVALDAAGDTLWTLQGDIVTVYYYNRYPDMVTRCDSVVPAVLPGNFTFTGVVRDEARLLSDATRRRVVVDHDPETEMVRVPACDCPNPPPNCASADSVVAGWVTGYDDSLFTDPARWTLFCDGDTIPQRSHVRFFARGSDDARDLPRCPDEGLREVGYSWRFRYCLDAAGNNCNRVIPFSGEYDAAGYTLPPPPLAAWRGHSIGVPSLCPLNYRFYSSAVDEWGRRDGTPDSIAVYVGGAPSIDSVAVPSVVVFVPGCPSFFPAPCPDTTGVRFGPDTLMIVGTNVTDAGAPCLLGQNRFRLPLQVFGHDHPRDRQPQLELDDRGRIRAWFFRLTCLDAGCDDFVIGGEGQWRNDSRPSEEPIERQVFDDVLEVTLPLDTLQIQGTGCVPANIRAIVNPIRLGRQRFEIQGRDTPVVPDVTCLSPASLDSIPGFTELRFSDAGRTTEYLVKEVKFVQWKDVRPLKTNSAVAAKPGGVWRSERRLSP
jgi:hypothetical protein